MHKQLEINMKNNRILSANEELANALTHGIPFVFFLAMIPIPISYCLIHAQMLMAVAIGVFGFGLLLMLASSTLYHSIVDVVTKTKLRVVDHMSIFVMIAGTYTPFVVKYLPPTSRNGFLLFIWGIVIAGIIYKVFYTHGPRWISALIYIVMGLLSLFIIPSVYYQMAEGVFAFLAIGGLMYLIGVAFYLWRNLHYHHAIWHIFVFAGSVCHFWSVLLMASN